MSNTSTFLIQRRSFLKLAAAAVPAALVPDLIASRAFGAQAWDLACEYNATSYPVQLAKRFAELVAIKTGGEVAITIHAGASLGYKSADQFYAVADGALPLAFTLLPQLGGISPLLEVSSLPFIAVNLKESRALSVVARKYSADIFKANDQVQLFAEPDPGSGIWAKKPIRSKEDLAGLRIRTFDANSTRTMKAAGAVPFQLSWADVIPQLTAGAIDAVLTSAEGGTLISLWEHAPYFNEINYSMPLHTVHLNLSSLGKLKDEHQQAVKAASDEVEAFVWENQETRISTSNKRIIEAGATVVRDIPDPFVAHLRQAGEATLKDWLSRAGERGAALVDEYRRATA
jgi:TRAP-type C4-dicarboxylate transport system substrate-binding protein